ncbi:unnamed protein product [Ambrosiozyma monospora]|uniref:Unnamed protein product n=1 Tax=Ambrosiozyma monospora TaxID=43982 RepID=A0A9W6Z4S8_AMBMO|nr:unnamed protein product [Ambrosiozyma monospora]
MENGSESDEEPTDELEEDDATISDLVALLDSYLQNRSECGSEDESEPESEYNMPNRDEHEQYITVELVDDIADDTDSEDELDTSEPQFGRAFGSDEINQEPDDEAIRYRYFNLPIPRLYYPDTVSSGQRVSERGKENVPPLDDMHFEEDFFIDGDDELTSFLSVDELVSNFGPNDAAPATAVDLDIQNAIADSFPISNVGNRIDEDEYDASSDIDSPVDFEDELTITYSGLDQSTILVPLTSDHSALVDTATFPADNDGNESLYTADVSSETTEFFDAGSSPSSFVTANEPISIQYDTTELSDGDSDGDSDDNDSPGIPEGLQHNTLVSHHTTQQQQLNTTGFGFSKLQLEPFMSHQQIQSKVTTSIDGDLQRVETTFKLLIDSAASSPVPRMNLSMFGELVRATIKIVSSSLPHFSTGYNNYGSTSELRQPDEIEKRLSDAENDNNWTSTEKGLDILILMIKTVTLEEIDHCFETIFGFHEDEENIRLQSEQCDYHRQPPQQELVPSSPIKEPDPINKFNDNEINAEYLYPTLAERLEQQSNQIKLQIRQNRAEAWVKLEFLKIVLASRSKFLTELNINYDNEYEDNEIIDQVNETILKSLHRKIEKWLIDLVELNFLESNDSTIVNEDDEWIQLKLDEFMEVWDPIRLKMVKMFDGYVKIDGTSDQEIHLSILN